MAMTTQAQVGVGTLETEATCPRSSVGRGRDGCCASSACTSSRSLLCRNRSWSCSSSASSSSSRSSELWCPPHGRWENLLRYHRRSQRGRLLCESDTWPYGSRQLEFQLDTCHARRQLLVRTRTRRRATGVVLCTAADSTELSSADVSSEVDVARSRSSNHHEDYHHHEQEQQQQQQEQEQRLEKIAMEFRTCADNKCRMRLLLDYADRLPRLIKEECISANQVMGCTSRVWITARFGLDGRVWFSGDSDAELSRGLCAVLVEGLSGLTPEQILQVRQETLASMHLSPLTTRSRINGFYNMLKMMQKRAGELALTRDGLQPITPFPSLLITSDGKLKPQGDFAVAQSRFLSPDPVAVDALVSLLSSKKIGLVAHFYMDPEVQGVLAAAQKLWPHILISDSLVMADGAAKMADAGCTSIVVLGVDFMSENVRAILDRSGHEHVAVYRMSEMEIGCSLAMAAQGPDYTKFIDEASLTPNSVHVIYINTSLETKAEAHVKVPTITCTSSNVVQTVLQAFAQVPEATLWYGPDTYMGANLATSFQQMSTLSDKEIAAIHPAHNRETISNVLRHFRYFQDGVCIVHDLFGREVVDRVRAGYGDAFQTAHFEVPGEMFSLAMEAKQRQMGVVGSTSNILSFIAEKTHDAIAQGHDQRLQFVLGTESGMVTSIVNKVREILRKTELATDGKGPKVDVEIVFPVSSDAITSSSSSGTEAVNGKVEPSSQSPSSTAWQGVEKLKTSTTPAARGGVMGELSIVPGVQGGEGCSLSGGCASCPYMKMNSLTALLHVIRTIGTSAEPMLSTYKPRAYRELIGGLPLADVGCAPILHMRHFQKTGALSDEFVADIRSRVPIPTAL